MSYSAIRKRVRDIAQAPDATVVTQMTSDSDTDKVEHRCIQGALLRFSADRPRRLVARYAASGAWEYALATVITGWDEGYQIQRVVVPTGQQDRNVMDEADWEVYQRHEDGAWYLRFFDNAPGSDYFGVEGIRPHVLDSTTDTVTSDAPQLVDAFCKLAAAEVLEVLANYYARNAESTIGADGVNYSTQSDVYSRRAKALREEYAAQVKQTGGGGGGACGRFVDWDSSLTGGEDRLFHRRSLT
jgi:hypothetical protein